MGWGRIVEQSAYCGVWNLSSITELTPQTRCGVLCSCNPHAEEAETGASWAHWSIVWPNRQTPHPSQRPSLEDKTKWTVSEGRPKCPLQYLCIKNKRKGDRMWAEDTAQYRHFDQSYQRLQLLALQIKHPKQGGGRRVGVKPWVK